MGGAQFRGDCNQLKIENLQLPTPRLDPRFMGSPLFLTELLTGHEPGRARRPYRAGKSVAQVQVKRRLTGDGSPYRPRVFARFMEGARHSAAGGSLHRKLSGDAENVPALDAIPPAHEPRAVEAGFQPASEGGILPPGWEAGLTGSQGWLPLRFRGARRDKSSGWPPPRGRGPG